MIQFIETGIFTARITELMTDDEYKNVQQFLAQNVEVGALISGGGGLRKIRWASNRRRKGKRSGIRIIYYVYLKHHLYMIYSYDKDEQEDLTREQIKVLREYVKRRIL